MARKSPKGAFLKGVWPKGILLVAALLVLAWLGARPALQVATGYTAKQLCSGLKVSGLPEALLWQADLLPRMAVMGPLRQWLQAGVRVDADGVSSQLLGVHSRAYFEPGAGCTLHGKPSAGPAHLTGNRLVALASPAGDGSLGPVLDAAFAEPGGRNTLAVLVSHRGRLVAERYRAPVGAMTRLQGWSMNKSLMATWVGLQVQRGALSLQASAAEALLAAQRDDLAASVDAGLNLGHLLHMESGLDFKETYAPGDDATDMLYRRTAAWAVAPGRGQAHAPGTHFSYSSGDTNLAALIWQQSLKGEDYRAWLHRELAEPLGLLMVAEADASGVQVGSSYAYLRGRDWLRMGQLWLDAWHGRSNLLSQRWQRAAVTPRPAAADGGYGRGFWLNSGGVSFPGLPSSLFYASGNSGQAVVVLPEQELVVVRLGLSATGADTGLQALLEGVMRELAGPRPSPTDYNEAGHAPE
ncbi:serine hydrolase domain-containing protein [Parahaliea mediterranea]|uniref:serine hydrolase domain-containing protein n=1 Tax=Parahaliea mediterranea TaxID=651086 RepID=UPI0019D4955F|nr:serine hydrolase [Parahaliea mediterranea]